MIKSVLLAAKVDPSDPVIALRQIESLEYPVIGSPKIDGIRCHTTNGVLSRKNKLIPNHFVRGYLEHEELSHLDGELVVGSPFSPSCFNTTQSGVMSQDGKPNFKYLIFDLVDESGSIPFDVRISLLRNRLLPITPRYSRLHMVPQRFLYNPQEVLDFEEKMVTCGWEGIMLRNPHGRYKQGRSTLHEEILIKVKRFMDSEAEILGAYEQETNLNVAVINEVGRSKRSSHKENKIPNGHLGGFYVRDKKTGIEFDIGTFQGVTMEQRHEMWITFLSNPEKFLHKTVTYKYFPVGVKNKPRHPILLGFRYDLGENDEISE
jgi:DNA ligase-1